jgi:predicted DNA-binding transcriptional regulator AlpA
MEHTHDAGVTAASGLSALQLADREQLHQTLRPQMSKAAFGNWLWRAQRQHGFPQPVRTGARSCAWLVTEVRAWLDARPRKGAFLGRRRDEMSAA